MRKLLKQAELTAAGLGSRTKIWRKSRDPDDPFPPPVETGVNSIGWYEDEIEAYQESLQRRGPEKPCIATDEQAQSDHSMIGHNSRGLSDPDDELPDQAVPPP